MLSNVRIGVVGCGYWGPNLIRNFQALTDCQVTVISDVDPARLKHLHGLYRNVEMTTDYRQLVEREDVDAVVVATPVAWHHRIAKSSLLAGKHTFVEKPVGTSSADCIELAEISERNGCVLMAGYTFLYSPAIAKIKQIIDAGDLGEIRYIAARRLNLGLFQRDINVTWDLAPHDLSIILHVMGEYPVSLNCRGSANVTPGIEDVASLNLTFSRQRSAIVHNSWLDPRKTREMTIVGSRRMIVYDDVAVAEKIRVFDARVDHPPHYDTFAEFHYAYHYGDVYAPYIKQEEPLKLECQHFLDCIRMGVQPMTDAHLASGMLRLLEASTVSLRAEGAPVFFDSNAAGAGAGLRVGAKERNGKAHARGGNGTIHLTGRSTLPMAVQSRTTVPE
ncbi:MAG: Gfo/Idh/MocA family oxidoreductase [Verrucomicrobiales bacterium]|nr:Gfo/Idh/MocA family oxidoreductase [Verrucomicrobiales bacterium]